MITKTLDAIAAPPITQQLIARFLLAPDKALIVAANREADRILNLDHLHEPNEDVARWVQGAAETYLEETNPALLKDSSDYRRFGGDFQSAFMEPSFCLGFALAHQLFAQKGGAR